MKKDLQTKTILQEQYKIVTIRNDFNSKVPTEVGFFDHHLVRHDTIECTRLLSSLLPPDLPPYQQELSTVWAGPPNKRQGVGVMKIYADK
jgi:hypothetical protein